MRRTALSEPAPFSVTRNHVGGEDDLLFQQMKAAGARFAWAPEAWVWEHPDPSRITLAYALRRAFALDRAARGLGKVLWFPPFKPRFYGLPADIAHG